MRGGRQKLVPLGLAAAAYLVAILQRPGVTVAETKVDLHVSPLSFLADVLSAWTPSQSLGHVFAGQYGGYLWPMAPWFALGHVLGLPPWLVDRLWLGTLLALAAWGTVRLLDQLVGRPRGVAHVVAGLLFAFNPYVVTYAGRTSIALLAYAALPWLLVCVHGGLREPRAWWWPAAFALILTSIGGGVNVAVIAWLLLGPAVLAAYELGWGGVAWRAARGFAARLAGLAAVTSLWWVAAVVVHALFGLAFLRFTEQPGSIWGTTSLPETLRLMGFWTSYIGVGYTGTLRPFQADAVAYLSNPAVIAATLLVPALALLGFAWTRRVRYAPFFLLLVLVGVVVMTVGFPEGTPLRKASTFTYNHLQAVQFLRTTYKAGPLVALGLAGLGGLAAAEVSSRLRRAPARAALAAGGLALVALTCWPFARGVGVDRQLALDRVPAAWRGAAADLDRSLPPGDRAMVLPGQLFAYYRWGGTYDPILPALTDRPTAVRFIVPFSDLRSYELQLATDNLVSQQRAVPGQLRPLLSRLGVGRVVVGSDDDLSRSGAVSAADAAAVLRGQGLDRATRAYGPVRAVVPAARSLADPERLPQVRTYDLPTPGLVRLLPRGAETTLDGSAQGLVDLAAFGGPAPDRAVRYAGDLDAAQIRAAARAGGEVVISDSSRRRAFVAARMFGSWGWTLTQDDPISQDGTQLDPFPGRGTAAQTIAVLSGARSVRAPFSPGFEQFPERRPFAAVDGDPSTAWLADRALDVGRHRLEVRFDRPRDVPYVDLLPYSDGRGVTKVVSVNGRRFALSPGWNRLRLGLRAAQGVEVAIVEVEQPPVGDGGAGGIAELRVPGLRVSETLRPPVLAEHALRGQDLSRTPLSYVFSRTTGDDPFHPRTVVGDRQAGLVRDQQDGERAWSRRIAPPAARSWQAEAWTSVAPEAGDALLDRLAGTRAGGASFSGSARFAGLPGNRASSAFDGDPRTGWVAGWVDPGWRRPGTRAWLGWTLPAATTIRALDLVPLSARVRRPSAVRLLVDGVPGPLAGVGPDGHVALARPVRGRSFRLEVVRASFPRGATRRERRRRAVGVAEIRFDGAPRATVPRHGPLAVGCADGPVLTAAGRRLPMRVTGTLADLDAGRPLRARPCRAVALPAGTVDVHAAAAPWRLDLVRLASAAPAGPPPAPAAGARGRVLSAGSGGRGSRDGVRLAPAGPSWLVLGESYDRGWSARCDGHDLGRPVPLEGFANGWPAGAGCHDASFAFTPNRWLLVADAISLAACLALLILLVARRRRPSLVTTRAPLPDAAWRRWPARRAVAAGAAAAAVLGFVFALRAGLVLGPLVALVLWRGIGARALALAGGALLVVVVPALYLVLPRAPQGYETNWAVDHIAPHWVAVLAVSALGASLFRTLAAARGRDGER